MLVELRISQLAIVDELTVSFGPGLTMLTGETGAGKSVIAGALGLLCGRHVPKELVREGEEAAWVEGVFDLSESPGRRAELAGMGVRVGSDGILLLRRELRLQGRSRVIINGLVSSLALLERIGPLLMSVQSQDQQRELGEPAYARDLLDELASAERERTEVQESWHEFRETGAALAARQAEERVAAEQLELWRWQAQELAAASLRVGEEEELAEALVVKRHAGALQTAAAAALGRLEEGESPALEDLRAAVAALRPLAGKSQRLGAALAELETVARAAGEVAAQLRRFLDGLDADAADVDALEARRALYHELERKYQRDAGQLLDLLADLQRRIARHEEASGDLDALVAAHERARQRLEERCARLHASRAKAAPRVAERAAACIRPLALPAFEVAFDVRLRERTGGPITIEGRAAEAGPEGADAVVLVVRTNRGERAGDVAGIASGGERSRIHLGLTALRRRAAEPPLLLCDEIDAGLGMDSARPVASLLRDVSRAGQVLCITHIPTMAVHGDAHLRVSKHVRGGRTVLRVAALTGEDRVREVERLLGGEVSGAGTAESRFSYAAALLAAAEEERRAEGLRAGGFGG